MSDKISKKCLICGKDYEPCIICEKNKNRYAGWRLFTDTIDCFKIYAILTTESSDEEKKIKLEGCNLIDLDSFQEEVKKEIKRILAIVSKKNTNKEENIKKEIPVKTE